MLSPTADQHTHIKKDLLHIAKEMVRKRGRRLSDLRFAKRTPLGYAFFREVVGEWNLLHEIVEEAAMKFPQYEFAVVVDIASELFNQDAEDLEDLQMAL